MVEAKFNEQTGHYEVDIKPEETASLEQAGIVGGLTRFEVFGLPVGAAATATAVAVLVDRLLGGQISRLGLDSRMTNLLVAWAVKQWGTRFLGSVAANATAFVLTYEAIADTIEGALAGVLPRASAAQVAQAGLKQAGLAQRVAETPGSRYAGAF